MYNNLAGGSRARLNSYRRNAAQSLETIRKNHAPESPYRLNAESDPQPWKRARYISPHGLGFNVPGTMFTRSEDGRKMYGDSGALDHLRELSGEDTPRDYGRGWYTGEHCSETVTGRVAVLPSRKDGHRFLAYIVWSDCDGITIDSEPFEDARAAWNRADDMARNTAEREREYNEQWNLARDSYESREELREELRVAYGRARGAVRAMRELTAGMDSTRAVLAVVLDDARADIRHALRGIARHSEALADYAANGIEV